MRRPAEQVSHSENSAGRLLDKMRQRFPVLADSLPLVSGIENELAPHFAGVPNWRIIAALRRHVNGRRYLEAVLRGEQRFNLLGDPVGEITESERAYARERLNRLGSVSEGASSEADILADIKHGQRLMLSRLVASRFGDDVAEASRPYLERISDEAQLGAVGEALLDCYTADDWLQQLRERAPAEV
jgi:ProP effector